MERMGTTFPLTRRNRAGYRVEEVEQFLEDARRAYDRPPEQTGGLDSEAIRHTAFRMERGGYSTAHVDAALERLEDAFALREREAACRTEGDKAWFGRARASAEEILNRLARPDHHRFARVGQLSEGYSRAEVDRFCARLRQFFREGENVSADEVRTVAFRTQRGGYREQQVDLFLDSVIDVMLAVR